MSKGKIKVDKNNEGRGDIKKKKLRTMFEFFTNSMVKIQIWFCTF